ncbi:WPP domain-interacting protein 2 [Iris pallida]|uniref:WPP domain-interacting protein 2 n=1 Tax=Iris pallida TaxID=29817 RepID=A0AAX6E8P1_IRIPA|nr:WPP domain-interacting protein 2 [Iris pallida]
MDMEENQSKSELEGWKEEEGFEIVEKMATFGAIREEIDRGTASEEVSELNVESGEDKALKVNGDEVGEEEAVEAPIVAVGSPPLAQKANGDVIGEGMDSIGSPRLVPKVNGEGFGEARECESPEVGSSSPAVVKGYGLKKWRRIRRDSNKDGSPGADSSVIHKRRYSVNEPPKTRGEIKSNNDVEIEVEVEAPVPSVGSARSVEAVEAAPMDPGLAHLATSFSIGMDSDNSEERSSKSSTAASGPKPRHEVGFGRERVRLKNLAGGRGAGNTLQQRGQRGRGGGLDASKKSRGDRIRLEKEKSQSSIDSDLRSSNIGFTRRGSGVSNGRQSDNSQNFDAEYSDEAQTCEEVRSAYYKENGGVEDSPREDFDVDLSDKETDGTSGKFRPPSGVDPFIESIVLLQTAQEALELEIQKIGEIGKEATVDGLDGQFEDTEVSNSPAFDANLLELSREVECLQHKLEATVATAKSKESKVLELEAIINRIQSPKEEACSISPLLLNEMHQKLESELESLLKKKIEAEIEYLIITRTTQSWKLLTEDQIALLEEQKSLAGDQAQMTLKLKEAECKALKVKDRADELGAYCNVLLQTENTLKLKNKVCKFSLCFFLQLLLLCIAFGLFLIQLLPQSNDVVPT